MKIDVNLLRNEEEVKKPPRKSWKDKRRKPKVAKDDLSVEPIETVVEDVEVIEPIEDVEVIESIEDVEDTEVIEDTEGVEDEEPKKSLKVVVITTVVGILAFGAMTMGWMHLINKVNYSTTLEAKSVINTAHQKLLESPVEDFEALVFERDNAGVEDIIIDGLEVSDEAYEARIVKLQEEIETLKAELTAARANEADPNAPVETAPPVITEVEVPSVDATNAEIVKLRAALLAAEAREKSLREELEAFRRGR